MKDVCLAFIDRKIPIILEKPGGVSAADVGEVRAAAQANGVPVAVAFIQRAGNLWKHLQKVGALDYATFLFQSGPPERYINQSPWALQRVHAGGGAFINLAVHYIDLFLAATEAQSVTVQAQEQYRLSARLRRRGPDDRAGQHRRWSIGRDRGGLHLPVLARRPLSRLLGPGRRWLPGHRPQRRHRDDVDRRPARPRSPTRTWIPDR